MLTSRKARGFTLVEALVGLALLLAGLAGAAIVLLQGVQNERESATRRVAMRLAASLADELRASHRTDAIADPASPPVATWREAAIAALPSGATVSVATGAAMPFEYVITIDWPVAGIGRQRFVLPVTP